MAEPIVFKLGITRLFRTAKCVNVRAGDFYDLKAAPEDAEPISDTLVTCPEIMLVTAGAFDMIVPGLGTIEMHAGDIGSAERFKGPIRIEAKQDDSDYACITPRDGSLWQREAGFAVAGETMTIDIPPCEAAYLYVATGGLETDSDGTGEVGTFRPLEPGEHEITAAHPTRFITVWR